MMDSLGLPLAESSAAAEEDGGPIAEPESDTLEDLGRDATSGEHDALSSDSSSSCSSSDSSSTSDSSSSSDSMSDLDLSPDDDMQSTPTGSNNPPAISTPRAEANTSCLAGLRIAASSRYPLCTIPEACEDSDSTGSTSPGRTTDSFDGPDQEFDLKQREQDGKAVDASEEARRENVGSDQHPAFQEEAALRLQRYFRKWLARGKKSDRALRQEKAALWLQRWFRKRVNGRRVTEAAGTHLRRLSDASILELALELPCRISMSSGDDDEFLSPEQSISPRCPTFVEEPVESRYPSQWQEKLLKITLGPSPCRAGTIKRFEDKDDEDDEISERHSSSSSSQDSEGEVEASTDSKNVADGGYSYDEFAEAIDQLQHRTVSRPLTWKPRKTTRWTPRRKSLLDSASSRQMSPVHTSIHPLSPGAAPSDFSCEAQDSGSNWSSWLSACVCRDESTCNPVTVGGTDEELVVDEWKKTSLSTVDQEHPSLRLHQKAAVHKPA